MNWPWTKEKLKVIEESKVSNFYLTDQFQTPQDPTIDTINIIIWKNNNKYQYPSSQGPLWDTKNHWMVEIHSSPCHAGMTIHHTFEEAFRYANNCTNNYQTRILIRKPIEEKL